MPLSLSFLSCLSSRDPSDVSCDRWVDSDSQFGSKQSCSVYICLFITWSSTGQLSREGSRWRLRLFPLAICPVSEQHLLPKSTRAMKQSGRAVALNFISLGWFTYAWNHSVDVSNSSYSQLILRKAWVADAVETQYAISVTFALNWIGIGCSSGAKAVNGDECADDCLTVPCWTDGNFLWICVSMKCASRHLLCVHSLLEKVLDIYL